MAERTRYSERPIDAALDEIGELVTLLSERDKEVARLIAELATRVERLEARVGTAAAPHL